MATISSSERSELMPVASVRSRQLEAEKAATKSSILTSLTVLVATVLFRPLEAGERATIRSSRTSNLVPVASVLSPHCNWICGHNEQQHEKSNRPSRSRSLSPRMGSKCWRMKKVQVERVPGGCSSRRKEGEVARTIIWEEGTSTIQGKKSTIYKEKNTNSSDLTRPSAPIHKMR